MVCPQCGARNPECVANCIFCDEPLALPERKQAETAPRSATAEPDELTYGPEQLQGDAPAEGRDGETSHAHRSPTVEARAGDPSEEEEDVFRELFAEVVEINRRIKRQKSEIDHETLAGLYTARSFSTPEAMGRTTAAIRQLLRTNQHLAGELERALGRIKARVRTANWSQVEKRRFWNEIADGFLTRFKLRPAILEKQTRWTEATIDLYEFVLAHSDELSFEGKSVRTSERDTGEEFVRRLRLAKQYRDAFRAATDRIGEVRGEALGRRRVADSGLK